MRRLPAVLGAVCLGALLWVVAPALSLAPWVPRAVDFETAVPLPAGARAAAAGRVVTPPLRAPRRFDLVGFRWRSPATVDLRLRVRRDGGRWSHWVTVPDGADHGAGRGSDPVWAGGADRYQLAVRGRVTGLRAHFVNATGTATAADRLRTALRRGAHAAVVALVAPVAQAQGGAPAIVPRADWGADQCPPRTDPSYGSVQMAFVHHTVSANDYAPEDSKAIVLATCRYHRNSNGWNDVGYNFLVDKYGTIFEGRAGGIDQAVIGAQAQGWNSQSTGIATLGTWSDTPLPEPALAALASLIRWKLPLHGVPTQGTVTLKSGGGKLNRYPGGALVTFERISGHRDGGKTECPGNALYAQLPRLRELVGNVQPLAPAGSTLSLSAESSQLVWPATAILSGRLTLPDGTAAAGAPVRVQLLGAYGFRTVARSTTAADGSWTASVPTGRTRVFRALAPAASGGPSTTSERLSIGVRPLLDARARARRVPLGRAIVVSGAVRPSKPNLRLVVERQAGVVFRPFGAAPVRAQGGRFRALSRPRRPGLYRLRVAFRGDRANLAGSAPAVFVRVVRGRVAAR